MQRSAEDKNNAKRSSSYIAACIHCPVTTLGAHMWLSSPPDLTYWAISASCCKLGVVVGGMPMRLDSVPRLSTPKRDGSLSITGCGRLRRAASTAWAWRCLISRIPASASSGETLGCLGRKPIMSGRETRSICTMAQRFLYRFGNRKYSRPTGVAGREYRAGRYRSPTA
jgi:hypothetical protein